MGRVNNWLAARLDVPAGLRTAALVGGELPETLPLIIEAQTDADVPAVLSQITERIPGVRTAGAVFNFTRVVAPTEALDLLEAIPEIKTISYDAPAWIRQVFEDPLLGRIELSPITVPQGLGQSALWAPLRFGLNLLTIPQQIGGLGIPVPFAGPTPQGADVIIIPSSETRKWMGVSEDDVSVSVPVAVLDTGITFPHPLLRNVPSAFTTTGEPPLDALGHGQWCATTAFGGAFRTRFGECRGVVQAERLISVKCLSNIGFGSTWSVIQAMERAWAEGARVVNMSLGGPQQGSVTEDPQCQIVERLRDDVIFVVAAGNSGPGQWTIGSPGISPFALTVGSWSTQYNGLSIFSSQGPSGEFYRDDSEAWTRDHSIFGDALVKPDCVAPGGGPVSQGDPSDQIYSGVTGWMDGMQDLTAGDGFDAMRGTSMATPHVAGLIAFAVDRGLVRTAADVKQALATAVSKRPDVGYGLINLNRIAPGFDDEAPGVTPPAPAPAPSPDPTLTSLALTPASASLLVGELQQFTALGTFSDGSTQDLTLSVAWSSSDPAVVLVGPTGLATALADGSVTVSASISGVVASATVAVSSPAPTLASMALTPASVSLVVGEVQQFIATGLLSDNTPVDLTATVVWATSNPLVATIDAAGFATSIAPGVTEITATSAGISASGTLDVVAPAPTLVSVAVTPASASLLVGQTQQFIASGIFSDGSTQDLTLSAAWTSSNPVVGLVGPTGLVTALADGSATITASISGVTGSGTLAVATPAPTLVSLSLNPASASLLVGETQQFTALGTFSDDSSSNLTLSAAWTSSDPFVAGVGLTGLVTALADGSATITASISGVTASAAIGVSTPAPTLTSLALTPVSASLLVGELQQFTAVGTFSDGSSQDLTATAVWTSSDPFVAGVGLSGLVTALADGSATITASISGVVASATIGVSTPAPTLTSLALTPASASLLVGELQQFTALGTFSDGSSQDLTLSAAWSSSDPAVANVGLSGLVTALADGSATITASVSGVTASAAIAVSTPVVALVLMVLTPPSPVLLVGDILQVTALGTFSDGSFQDLTLSAAWSSSDPAVATVNATGLVTAVGPGTTTISALFDGITGNSIVDSLAPPAVTATPTIYPDLFTGDSFQVNFTIANPNSRTIAGVAWRVVRNGIELVAGITPDILTGATQLVNAQAVVPPQTVSPLIRNMDILVSWPTGSIVGSAGSLTTYALVLPPALPPITGSIVLLQSAFGVDRVAGTAGWAGEIANGSLDTVFYRAELFVYLNGVLVASDSVAQGIGLAPGQSIFPVSPFASFASVPPNWPLTVVLTFPDTGFPSIIHALDTAESR